MNIGSSFSHAHVNQEIAEEEFDVDEEGEGLIGAHQGGRSANYTMAEDKLLCKTWLTIGIKCWQKKMLATNMNAPSAGDGGYVGMGALAGVFGAGYGGMGAQTGMFGGGMTGMSAMGCIAGMGSMADMGGMGLGGFGGVFGGTSAPMTGM
jgi:hypothetical protein